MKIWIDADGCPVVDQTIGLAKQYALPVAIVCDTSHEFAREGAETITVSKGADSTDFALVNRLSSGDVVVTQDYGLAAMCLAKGARPIRQDGVMYTADTIDSLLEQRYIAKKVRQAGGRFKGSRKRNRADDEAFIAGLKELLER